MNRAFLSMFDRMAISIHGLPRWLRLAIGILFLALPFGIAYLEGSLSVVLNTGVWRYLILPPVIVIYVLAVAPVMLRSEQKVVDGLRPIIRMDDEELDRLIATSSRIRPRHEWMAIGVGAIIALGTSDWSWTQPTLLRLYIVPSTMAMYGLLGWVVFLSFAGIRVQTALHHQPLDVDIFDLTPFEPIGQQSLIVSLVFVGGTTISLFLVYTRENYLSWQDLVTYSLWILIIILLFFFNMWQTHGLLSSVKKQALAEAQRKIAHAYRQLKDLPGNQAHTQIVSAEVDAWIQMEQRLKLTRTWPYNTEMLRTLFISILVPLLAGLARLGAVLFGN